MIKSWQILQSISIQGCRKGVTAENILTSNKYDLIDRWDNGQNTYNLIWFARILHIALWGLTYEHVQSSHNNEEYTESPNEQCDQDEQNSKNGTIYKSVVLESMIILMGLISYKVLDNFNFLNKAHNKISYIGRCNERQSFRMVAMHWKTVPKEKYVKHQVFF